MGTLGMDLKLQPKPDVEVQPADRGIVSRKSYFVKKKFEEIRPNFFPAHFVRKWRPKVELLFPPPPNEDDILYECDFNRNVQSCFVEDYAEEVYLRTPPPCFLVLGKFGASVIKLSKAIAEEYGSVLLRVDDIVNKVMQTDTKTSRFLDKVLRLGVSLTLNFILALLSFVAHTAEARHRGYVLCGLPASPYAHDLSVEHQMNYVFSWENKPTVFVHILSEDEDLIRARNNLLFEVTVCGKIKCIAIHSGYKDEKDEMSDEEDALTSSQKDASEMHDINVSPSRPAAHLPRDEEHQVWSELELYDIQIKPVIDLIKSRVDPQYFITVDSRIKNEFEMVKARLKLLQIWKVPLPFPFFPKEQKKVIQEEMPGEDVDDEEEGEEEDEGGQKGKILEEDEEDWEIKHIIEEPPQIAFRTLFTKKTISPKFRWELSHYNYVCPVSLRSGVIVEGKSKFAVVFMKYIYFLHDEESMMLFLKNPRPYVLPIRPKPPCHFFVLGLPFCGKSSIASLLSQEFQIPLIDARVVLKEDLERKKIIYQEFCRQKAECNEIIRLTAQAWKDWRLEEEQRISLVESWVLYVQTLLYRRIQQFYSVDTDDVSAKETQVQSHSPFGSSKSSEREGESGEWDPEDKKPDKKSFEVRGIPLGVESHNPYNRERTPEEDPSTPSAKIIQALKHEDFNFDEPSFQVEANLFFSSLWNNFAKAGDDTNSSKKGVDEQEGEEESIYGEDKEVSYKNSLSDDQISLNWCNLLPLQSLSTFLLFKTPYTPRQKRKSFRIFLDAAAKNYWAPSPLKKEFAKWRLPCFMDIPLCEIFLDNPLLLFKYCPQWLKERPLIPDPVDPMHPSVIEAGRRAYQLAGNVKVRHKKQEVAVLLRDALEKAEREGMRITGEVITPGGWVVDNMLLDIEVWSWLAEENVYPDNIYFLTESDPQYKRIINHWYDLFTVPSKELSIDANYISKELLNVTSEDFSSPESYSCEEIEELQNGEVKKLGMSPRKSLALLLTEKTHMIAAGDKKLDEIFEAIVATTNELEKYYHLCHVTSVDQLLNYDVNNSDEKPKSSDAKEGGKSHDGSHNSHNSQHFHNMPSQPVKTNELGFFSGRFLIRLASEAPLGAPLQVFSKKVLTYLKSKHEEKEKREGTSFLDDLRDQFEFLHKLLNLPDQLEKLKNWLVSIGRSDVVKEIVITGKSVQEVFKEIKKGLYSHFIKKPRELESFERDEILKEIQKENPKRPITFEGEEENEEEGEKEEVGESESVIEQKENEDVRIFGESGQLCIVNLERHILLQGKQEFVLRYYGKLYFFFNQAAKDKFIEDPEKYAPYYSPIRCYPPLRLYILGPVGTGKTALCKEMGRQLGLFVSDHLEFANTNLLPHELYTSRKITAVHKHSPVLMEDYNQAAKDLKEKFLNCPYGKRRFWLENPLFDYMEDQKKSIVDAFMNSNKEPIFLDFPELNYSTINVSGEEFSNYQNPNQENRFVSMKEIQNILDKYVQNIGPFTDYCVDNSLKLLWTREPFIRTGFAIEVFPLRKSDIEIILKNNWYPDLVIEVFLPENVVVKRLIEKYMALWEEKVKQDIEDKKLLEDTLTTIQRTLKEYRRNTLYREMKKTRSKKTVHGNESTEKEPKSEFQKGKKSVITTPTQEYNDSSSSSSERSFNIEDKNIEGKLMRNVDAEAQEKVEKILEEEYPPLVFNTVYESYEAASERVRADVISNYRRDVEELHKIRTSFQNFNVPWMKLDNTKEVRETLCAPFIHLNKVRKRTNQKGEFAFPMSMETAEKLLKQGFYFLSKFGRWCPVQVYRLRNPIHMFRPLLKKRKIFPVAYRNYIYFVGGENEKKNFIEDPIKYTINDPHHPNIPLRIAVIGPPKSGKSTLSARLGLMFDLKVVTMGSALRFVVEKMPHTTLQKSIECYLRRGCFIPLSLKTEALIAFLNDPACVTQGFVFDGIPFDAAMAQSLAEEGKLPFVIISLMADSYFGKVNRQKLDVSTFRLPYKQRTNLGVRYKEWDETYKRFVQWNQDTYCNLYEVNAKLSVVDVFYTAYDIIRKSYFSILYYFEYCITNKALPLEYLCVSQHEYELRKSLYRNNCPVCWMEKNHLSNTPDPPPRSGLVQYLNYFYWICPKDMKKFIKNPKMFLSPSVPPFPEILPKVLNRSMFEKVTESLNIHGKGRCPVTRTDFPGSLDWEGSWDYAVSYADEVFLCKNQEMLDRFLARPWRYCTADTAFEFKRSTKSTAIEKLCPPKITSLPHVGFLEQTVSNLLHEALQILVAVRPVYPTLSVACTGCVFLGLYLKVHNKKNIRSDLDHPYLQSMYKKCCAFYFRVTDMKQQEEMENKLENSESRITSSSSSEDLMSDRNSQFFSKSEETYKRSFDSHVIDIEAPADKKMWSAKYVYPNSELMRLTVAGDLEELPDYSMPKVILRYRTEGLKLNPLPPVSHCITFLYSCKSDLLPPEKFNVDWLYQRPIVKGVVRDTKKMVILDKPFTHDVVERESEKTLSDTYIWKGPRTVSDVSVGPDMMVPLQKDREMDSKTVAENFVPRFKLLDKVSSVDIPKIPVIEEVQPIIFNPHRDYAYSLLLSEFFHTGHVLRCFQWEKWVRHLEVISKFDRNLGLCNARSQFLIPPKITTSMRTVKSGPSYERMLSITSNFYTYNESERSSSEESSKKDSIANFVHKIIMEQLDEAFTQLSFSHLTYDSYDSVGSAASNQDGEGRMVEIQEVLPYPPLAWDIASRPYYAFRSIASLFNIPPTEQIAHEKHFSLLDGITEPYDTIRFLRYPTSALESSQNVPCKTRNCAWNIPLEYGGKERYFVYDFFNLCWTSFMTYPFSWSYDTDLRAKFCEDTACNNFSIAAEQI